MSLDEEKWLSFFEPTREGWESMQAMVQAYTASTQNTLMVLKAHAFEVNSDGWRAAIDRLRENSDLIGADDLSRRAIRWQRAMESGDAETLRKVPQTLDSAVKLWSEDMRELLDRRWSELGLG
jgi:hypothetical protein